MNGPAEMAATANLGRGDAARDAVEQMHIRFAEMDDACGLRRGRLEQFRRNRPAKRLHAKARTADDNEVAGGEQRSIVAPRGNFEEGVYTKEEKKAVAGMGEAMTEAADCVERIVDAAPREIVAGFGERREEVSVSGAGQRSHGETMRERRGVLLELVRRTAGNDEVNLVEMKAALRGASHRKMAGVNGIERAAVEGDVARARGSAMGGGGGQRSSDGVDAASASTGSAAGARSASASAMA